MPSGCPALAPSLCRCCGDRPDMGGEAAGAAATAWGPAVASLYGVPPPPASCPVASAPLPSLLLAAPPPVGVLCCCRGCCTGRCRAGWALEMVPSPPVSSAGNCRAAASAASSSRRRSLRSASPCCRVPSRAASSDAALSSRPLSACDTDATFLYICFGCRQSLQKAGRVSCCNAVPHFGQTLPRT